MKMLHVTIHTKRFADELAFCEEVLGLTIRRDMRKAGRDMVFLSDEEGDTCLEIIGAPDAEDAGNQNLSIGFKTEDVVKKREELIARGFEVTGMLEPGPGVRFFFTKDPAGVRIQFM